MLRDMRKVGLILFLLCLAVGVQAQSMPDFVLRAAQALNARYGQTVDVNNVFWDYTAYSRTGYAPKDYCPNLEANVPAFTDAVKQFYVVKFEIIRDGLRTPELWRYLVYDDFSYLGPCVVPQPPTPVPTQGPTAIPPTPGSCAGIVPRLAIGTQGRVTPGDPNNIRADHGTSTALLGEIPAGRVFTVLDGPRCTDSGTWWRVDFNGLQGWTLEGNAGIYFTEPASFVTPTAAPTLVGPTATLAPTLTPAPILPTAMPTQIICLPAIPPRLRIGETARVTAGGVPNNMREQSGKSSKLVGEIPPLGLFTVLDGPVCTGDGAWWRVDYNGVQGWTLEGMEAEYWVEPMLPNFQPLTLSNMTQMRPLPNWTGSRESKGWLPWMLGNDGHLLIRMGEVAHSWTSRDVYAPAETFDWELDPSDWIVPEARVFENGQWSVYGLPVPIAPDAQISDAQVVGSWVVFSQGITLSTINRTPEAAEADRIKALANPHGEAILAIDFSAKSGTLVTISAHTIYAWDTTTWQPRLVYSLSASDAVTEWPADLVFAISPSGQHLFVTPGNVTTGLVVSLQGNVQGRWASIMISQVQSAAFVRDEWIAIGGADPINNGLLVSLSVATLDALPILSEMAVTEPNGFTSIVVNPNGTLMATYNASTGIRVWGVWQP